VTGESVTGPVDPELQLLVPTDDVDDPEVSIVIPALDESLTIADFVAWCHEGLDDAGVVGEILIVDSSADDTAEQALAGGARVLRSPKRGLGRAYIDALPYIRGRYVVMGDADCTYDFRQLKPFVDAFHEGYEFVMGSRWKGSIEPDAMPGLHQYFGTPLTTWILNRVYSSHFSDIHCGMRGLTRDALERMEIASQSWEYASEMVLKSVHMGLRTTEVPVTFLKDREGRLSHHKRSGWFSPFSAAWINLRAMFVYGADFFVLRPGIALLALGLVFTLLPTFGPVGIGGLTLSLNWQLLGLVLAILGLEGFAFGCIAQVLFDYTGRARRRWLRWFPYTRTVIGAGVMFIVGVAATIPLVARYLTDGFQLTGDVQHVEHLALSGLLFVISGVTLSVFTLLLHAAAIASHPARATEVRL
jgi:glycosyltransferase involved in cell wall biosynthesis